MSQTVIPQLRVTNAERSRSFYVDGLGFVVDWTHQFQSGYPLFLQLTREGQTIFLTEHAGDCQVGGAVYFKVPNVASLAAAIQQRGVTSVQGPNNTPWGTREMVVTDPDGNRLRFGAELGA
jgi:catechol 2,3-dioxygenase-like lactoylglutathione lyase family enzyme